MSRLYTSIVLIALLLVGTNEAWAVNPQIEKARTLLRKERWSEADAILKNEAARNPNESDVHVALAELYVFMELPVKASSEIQRAFKIEPHPSKGHVYRVRAETNRICHRFSEAMADIDTACRLDGRDTGINHRYRARCWRVQNKRKQSLLEATKAVLIDEKRDASKEEMAANLEEKCQIESILGNDANALRDIDRAIEILPDSPACYRARGWFLRNRMKFANAMHDAEKALKINPSDVRALTLKATINGDRKLESEA
ncbi:MAG: tetratricopeptide repeat protein, partial [Cyanobacteria bacterium]|nr:tetratricopeptide repeat protein [Cyanobacteriota bacterium]